MNLLAGHGTNLRYSRGCRCSLCKRGRAAYEDSRRKGTLVRSLRARHGTRSMYVRGCRCGACREAARRYAEDCRRVAGVEEWSPGPHGTEARYRYGCRCDDCRAAGSRMNRADRRRHRDKRLAAQRASYEAHREECAERARHYRAEHPEECAERARRYRAEHPEETRARNRNRRALEAGSPGDHTATDVRAQYLRQHGRCYWCGEKVGRGYHVDHVIPLSPGGSNGPENIVIACPVCNLSKRDKLPMDWNGTLL